MKKPMGYWLARFSLVIFPTSKALEYVEKWDRPKEEEKPEKQDWSWLERLK
jgi:hypothetical protein